MRQFSATDIERVHVAMAQLPLPPRIKSLRLSYTDISTWFSNPLHLASLTELAFYPGGCQPEKIRWGRWDAYVPGTLQSLQFDTGHHPYVSAKIGQTKTPSQTRYTRPARGDSLIFKPPWASAFGVRTQWRAALSRGYSWGYCRHF